MWLKGGWHSTLELTAGARARMNALDSLPSEIRTAIHNSDYGMGARVFELAATLKAEGRAACFKLWNKYAAENNVRRAFHRRRDYGATLDRPTPQFATTEVRAARTAARLLDSL